MSAFEQLASRVRPQLASRSAAKHPSNASIRFRTTAKHNTVRPL
jgi:hypothetical protein